MSEKLRPEYQAELNELKDKMLSAQRFAEDFPAFADRILEYKFTEEFTGKVADTYKGMRFGWGINRYFYREVKNITNYMGELEPQYLWNIYINQAHLFGEGGYVDTGVRDIKNSVELFFFDQMNSTFYATDEQIISLLDALSEWFEKAKIINGDYKKAKKKNDLLKQLEAISD